jgi:small conductance mechanosensitive channel
MLSLLARHPFSMLDDWALRALHAAVYLLGAALASFVITRVARRALSAARLATSDPEREKQTHTFGDTARRFLLTIVWMMAAMLALKECGLDVGPLLAGAGVLGLAIGFAAQSVLKDWISGFFLLAEGRIRVNDVITVNTLSGTVEEISLRTTVLRDYDGQLHVVPNGVIQNFTNATYGHSYAAFDIPIAFGDSIDACRDLITAICALPEFAADVLAPLEWSGPDRLTESGIICKARVKTRPGRQWDVRRRTIQLFTEQAPARGLHLATAPRRVQLSGEL